MSKSVTPPANILDELVEAAVESALFPEGTRFTKRAFKGAHGHSSTQDVMVTLSDGKKYRIYAEQQPIETETRRVA